MVITMLAAMPASAETPISGRDLVYTGAYSDDWVAAGDLGQHSAIGQPLTFGGTFHHPLEGLTNTHWILDQVWEAGATPVANLEIFSTSYQIAAGFKDADILEWANSVRLWLDVDESRSLFIAPLVEMNGDWVPWGMDPGNYQIAFGRIHDMFTELGMDETKVRWIFGPNASSTWPHSIADYWPGEDVVDVIGLSAYNRGGSVWYSFQDVVAPAMEELRALAPSKPFLITQIGTGSSGGDKHQWLIDMFDYSASDPNLVGFVYFNFNKESDWKVWDNSGVAWGWLRASVDPRVQYQFPLTGWFQPGSIPFDAAPEVIQDDEPASAASDTDPSFTGNEVIEQLRRPRLLTSAARPE